jgi:hypothetical protein
VCWWKYCLQSDRTQRSLTHVETYKQDCYTLSKVNTFPFMNKGYNCNCGYDESRIIFETPSPEWISDCISYLEVISKQGVVAIIYSSTYRLSLINILKSKDLKVEPCRPQDFIFLIDSALSTSPQSISKSYISLNRKKSDTTQFLWVTIDPTYKLTAGKLSVQYALFTYVSICSFRFFNFEYSN